MSRFLEALHSGRVLLMDGAMGTELQRAGMGEGECYELWNLTHPDRVLAVHWSYLEAGAEVLLTNTFQANPAALAKYGLEDRLEEIIQAGVTLARTAAGTSGFVLGSVGPFPDHLSLSSGTRLIRSLGSADALVLETASSLANLGVLLKAQETLPAEPLPVLFSATYWRSAKGLQGKDGGLQPEEIAEKVAAGERVAALGINCGRDVGMDEVLEIIRRYRRVSDLPLFARPNAGTPVRVGDRWVYPQGPEAMRARLPELLEAGVCMVGGCCGTTPQTIAAFRPVVDHGNARRTGKGTGA